MAGQIDLHMHSTASDGTDTPAELVNKVAQAGIRVFALTDHDTVAGMEGIRSLVPEGMTFIPGIELSCRMPSGKCHILGYGCDTCSPAFQKILSAGAALRRAKLEKRLDFLCERGITFPEEEVVRLRNMSSAGKPHLGNLMVKYGYANTKKEAIENTINLCRTESSRVPAKLAVQSILASGGIPVWAHPLGGEGEDEIPEAQFQTMLAELIGYGLRGLECFYSKYPLSRCQWLAGIAEERGLLISGGSDYHGANKSIALGTLNNQKEPVCAKALTIINAAEIYREQVR